jgi:penicillin-binding protein 1A
VLILGLVSFVFGMFMAVASDLPALDNRAEFNNAKNSVLLDDQGRTLGVLAQKGRILVTPGDIPPIVREAVISIEDKRFNTNSGVDVRGIARAFLQDVLHKRGVQGASTIPQQFVKNALQAQSHRTIFEKLREAALAYHLTRRWSKKKILTEYLNTIYFGNGAYGVESAARTYFGRDVNHRGCGTIAHTCVSELKPWEAALLAGMIASPTGYDPIQHPMASKARRDQVLRNMLAQGYLTRQQYQDSVTQSLPAAADIQPPHQAQVGDLQTGYFTDWVRQQIIDRYGPQRAFDGGLTIRTSLDLDLQRAAETAINNYLAAPSGPSASLVAIDNATGQVRAMVGGRDFEKSPFNLATEGQRQPGSSFKAFVLAQALREGVSPDSVWSSRVKEFTVPGSRGREKFVVHNDNNVYSGSTTLTSATTFSDNSVFAEVGIDAGTRKIASLAHRMGIRTPLSTNPAMTIGGLKTGVTALDMAHAYETLAHRGQRVDGTLVPGGGPVGIEQVTADHGTLPSGHRHEIDHPVLTRVLAPGLADTETQMLQTVVQQGTGTAAQIGGFAAGKTGTTSNYGDAWFVGWNAKYTVAVWVGYPDQLRPMKTEFNGGPVLGGTFPALIWHDFMTTAIQVDQDRAARQAAKSGQSSSAGAGTTTTASPSAPAPTTGSASPAPSSGSSGGSRGPTGAAGAPHHTAAPPAPSAAPQPAPATPTPAPTPAPAPSAPPAPSGGGSGGTGAPSG